MGRNYEGKDHYKGIEIADSVREILDDYSVKTKRVTNDEIDKIGKEAVQKLKNTSPKRPNGGDYAKGWAFKRYRPRSGIIDVVVHNKTHYQLTHLLENGHRIVNAYGEFGRYNGVKHIAPVEEWAADELPKRIERELE